MQKAQCYYEILGISETASTEDVKKAYKREALVWHPDKNGDRAEEAHAKFQAILKAYETLSDSREREWYDRHKDQILSDGQAKEDLNGLNLFQYFSSACYANFDDQDDGFYTVYRNVFEQIAEEERQAVLLAEKYAKGKSKSETGKGLDDIYPPFGSSKSPYEDVVRPFYAFWSAFCTSLTFDHLDKYNTTEAENRRIVRAMEKENKKVKDAARKERNTNVRNLVEFVKKRDRRLKAQKLLVEQQNELNRQKTAEKQRQQREKGLKAKAAYQASAYLEMDDVEEQLRQLDEEYQDLKRGKRSRRRQKYASDDDASDDDDVEGAEQEARGPVAGESSNCDNTQTKESTAENGRLVGEQKLEEEGEEAEDDDSLDEAEGFFCPACNKEFRTIKAFENHEASKKHKQNVQKLTKLLREEEGQLNK